MHRNDNLIQDSVIEERRVEALLEVESRGHKETRTRSTDSFVEEEEITEESSYPRPV